MSVFFEIAYAAASRRLCLFTGTGFSKEVSSGNAPGWQALIEKCCPNDEIRNEMFPSGGGRLVSLEEAAQITDLELKKVGKNIHSEIFNIINNVTLSGVNPNIQKFLKQYPLKVITTNYDKLIEQIAGEDRSHSISPGLPIPRAPMDAEIYHIHGSIDSPYNMVVTSQDYFRFLNRETYFSKKLSYTVP